METIPLGQVLRIYMLMQGAHIAAMYIEFFSHGGVEERLKDLKCRIEEPVLIDYMQGRSAQGHGCLEYT